MDEGMKPPRVDLTNPLTLEDQRDLKWLLFSIEGRATRGEFWKGSLIVSLVALALVMGLSMFVGNLLELDPSAPDFGPTLMAIGGVVLVVGLPLLWVSVALAVKRWHDRGKSGAWVLVNLIPYIGSFWSFIECGCVRGTQGPNAYGPDPLG
jgi:uncharacterized membrane protein YhaH (DUF805 family)